jgi:uncharacterized protein HemX
MTDEEKGSLNAKIIGGLLLAATVTAGVLFFTSGKKRKSLSGNETESNTDQTNLGDLNTAKTKEGRIKQRKAVFAKLAEQGKVYRKNRVGKRTKKTKKK